MNLNNEEEEESFFTQHCLELAKLLRTDQTEHFLHLYDSLPSEWNGSRLESAKEYIRQLQELDENEFQHIYQRAFSNDEKEQNYSTIVMSKQSTIIRNDVNDSGQIIPTNSRITSFSILQKKQHIERTTANNLACDEQHDISSKTSLSSKKNNNDELNTKIRQLQSITNNNNTHDMISNNCRTRTPVDSFVQLNLKPTIDITVEDYKKTRVSLPTTKTSSTNNRSSLSQLIDTNEFNQQNNLLKKTKTSMENKSHEDASFDYFFQNNQDHREHSRSSSSSSPPTSSPPTTSSYSNSSNKKNDVTTNQTLSHKHSKLITNNDFDSHGSSIATKSSSENSGSARTGSDSDDEHHQSKKPNSSTITKSSLLSTKRLFDNDDTPTMVLNTTSDNRPNQHDRISSLPKQDSYELVQLNLNDEDRLRASQLPRFKLSPTDDTNSNNDILSYTTQRSQQNNSSSSSHQNQNSDRHEQYDTNHSNSSRKPTSRSSKKRKQLQQQEIIRTELIPGHRGDLDVDELVMFIDGNASSKQQQRQNSAPLRPTDTNKYKLTSSIPDLNSNHNNITATTRRKSRKPIKTLQESINNNNENKTSQVDEDTQSIGFIDEDDETTTTTTTTTHSINNTYNEQDLTNLSLPNDDDESHSNTIDIDSTNDSNTTNGEISLPEWLEPIRSTSPVNDDNDLFSLSSTTLNHSNSEITSEPFVTVTHRRRLTKERRQDTNSLLSRTSRIPSSSSSSNTNDKRRFQSTTQNGTGRSITRNGLSNTTPFVSTTTKEENINSPSQAVSQMSLLPPLPLLPTLSVSTNLTEQLSPRLSSHSSSSSLSSLLKRQSKPPPPVVFLNKSVDVELNDVSFGFDVENPTLEKPLTPTLSSSPPTSNEKESETLSSTQSNDLLINSKSSFSRHSYQQQQQQRNHRGPLFYSGSDIRPQHHNRNYPSQTPVTQSPYIDPLLLLQYNQQRLAANYSHQLAYMNLLRTQYIPSQSPYVFIPTTYTTTTTTTNDTNQDEKTLDDETIPTSERIQEPLLVYTTIPTQLGPIYLQPTKKSSNDLEQQIPVPTMYPPQYYYSTQPPHTAYFQPISSQSLLIDAKFQQDASDDEVEEEDDNDYEKSTRLIHPTRQQSSSHIMSNALQLVYSQERRNAQTDRFNLDQLTAYLAMKWTDTIDRYEQGDDEIVFTDEQ